MKITPNTDHVIVSIVETDQVTQSGIQIVQHKKIALKGKIEFAGHNAKTDERFLLSEGDFVYFPSLVGTDIEIEGKQLRVLRKEDLFFKIIE